MSETAQSPMVEVLAVMVRDATDAEKWRQANHPDFPNVTRTQLRWESDVARSLVAGLFAAVRDCTQTQTHNGFTLNFNELQAHALVALLGKVGPLRLTCYDGEETCDGSGGHLCRSQDPNDCDRARDCPAFASPAKAVQP